MGLAHRVVGGKGVFLLLSTQDRTLRMLDDTTFEPVGQIEIKLGRPLALAVSSNSSAPAFAYYSTSYNGANGMVGRINLDTKQDEGLIIRGDEVRELAVSFDGRTLYGRRPGSSPSGHRAWRIDADGSRVTLLNSLHEDSQAHVADPFGGLVASGKELRSPDLGRVIAKLDWPVRAFLRGRPVVLSATDNGIAAYSSNTYEAVGSVSFPDPAPAVERAPGKPGRGDRPTGWRRSADTPQQFVLEYGAVLYQRFIACDERRNIVMYLSENLVGIAPLSALKLPNEPMLAVRIEGPGECEVGQPLTLKLAALDPKAQVSLEGAPEGMTIDPAAGAIRWTPSSAQVGSFRFTLRMKSGALERAQETSVLVQRRSLIVPFGADVLALSPDARRAVAVSFAGGEKDEFGRAEAARFGRVAVYDVQQRKLIVDRALNFTANNAVAMGNDAVYLGATGTDALYALSLTDLSEVRRVFTPAQLNRLIVVGDDLYAFAYVSNSIDAKPLRYRLPKVEPIPDPPPTRSYRPYGTWPYPEPVDDGWLMRGVVTDASGKPRLLVRPIEFTEFTSSPRTYRRLNGREIHQSNDRAAVQTWDVALHGNQIARMTGQPIAQLDGGSPRNGSVVLRDRPAVVTLTADLRSGEGSAARTQSERIRLTVRDLVTGATRQTIALTDGPAELPRATQPEEPRIAAAGDSIVALANRKLFVVPIKDITARDIPEPLSFVHAQSAFVLPHDRPLTIECHVRGGKAPVAFAAAQDMPGVSVDAKTGAMTIDPEPFMERAPDVVQQIVMEQAMSQRNANEGAADTTTVLQRVAAPLQERFKVLTGKDAVGFPMSVAADVTARDDEQQPAMLNRVVLLDVPFDRLIPKVEKALAEDRQRRASATPPPPPALSAGDEAKARRLAEMERRVAELEAQNKLLRELVQPQAASTATQPASR
jgi:hypothetical protein